MFAGELSLELLSYIAVDLCDYVLVWAGACCQRKGWADSPTYLGLGHPKKRLADRRSSCCNAGTIVMEKSPR